MAEKQFKSYSVMKNSIYRKNLTETLTTIVSDVENYGEEMAKCIEISELNRIINSIKTKYTAIFALIKQTRDLMENQELSKEIGNQLLAQMQQALKLIDHLLS